VHLLPEGGAAEVAFKRALLLVHDPGVLVHRTLWQVFTTSVRTRLKFCLQFLNEILQECMYYLDS
jgi:hypothetical protein